MLSREAIQILRSQCRLSYSAYSRTYRNHATTENGGCTIIRCVHITTNPQATHLKNPDLTACSVTCVNANHWYVRHLHISSYLGRCEKTGSSDFIHDDNGKGTGLRTGVFTNGVEDSNLDQSDDGTDVESEKTTVKPNTCRANHEEAVKQKTKHSKEVDDFLKSRFYNIDKAAEYARAAHFEKARQRREIIEETDESVKSSTRTMKPASELIVRKPDIVEKRHIDFTNIVKPGESEPIITRLLKETENTDDFAPFTHDKAEISLTDEEDLPLKTEIPKLYHFAPLVNENTVLRNLVKIGVDLSRVPTVQVDRLIKMDFDKDIRPLLLNLHDIGVPGDSVPAVLTKNSNLLIMDLEHLKTRVRYLRWRKFSSSAVVSMVTRNSKFLSLSTLEMDKTLGYIQQQLWLTGPELRKLLTKAPRLFLCNRFDIKSRVHMLQDHCEFSKREVKLLVLNHASILYKIHLDRVAENFDYLHKEMMIPHRLLIQWPESLRKDINFLKTRHKFLEKLGRAQYDPEMPNYVAMKTLLTTNDVEFSVEVAKASVAEYNNFMRTV